MLFQLASRRLFKEIGDCRRLQNSFILSLDSWFSSERSGPQQQKQFRYSDRQRDQYVSSSSNRYDSQAFPSSQTYNASDSREESGSMLRTRLNRPKSLAFFTGDPTYYDFIYDLESRLKELVEKQKVVTEEKKKISLDEKEMLSLDKNDKLIWDWMPKASFEQSLNTSLKISEYRRILSQLNQLSDQPNAHLMDEFLNKYRKVKKVENPSDESLSMTEYGHIDEQGRAYALGRRKSSVARVWIVPGKGEFIVNGKPMVSYFPRMLDREELLASLCYVDRVLRYNIFAIVEGGGHSGQVGAIVLGISRAMTALEPSLRPQLRLGGFLTRDARVVERKKPGQKKARKKFQWVKR